VRRGVTHLRGRTSTAVKRGSYKKTTEQGGRGKNASYPLKSKGEEQAKGGKKKIVWGVTGRRVCSDLIEIILQYG